MQHRKTANEFRQLMPHRMTTNALVDEMAVASMQQRHSQTASGMHVAALLDGLWPLNRDLEEDSMIYRNNQLTRAVKYALLASAATAASTSMPAFAQEAQEAAPASEIGTVVVTGSRIPQPNLTSISPVRPLCDCCCP